MNRRHQVEMPNRSKEILLDRLTQEHQAYPPDLLSFPLRNSNQVSPSNIIQDKQINQKHIRSPIKSPNFETDFNPIMYNTLQSANSNQSTIPLINPKGYVTLPRRPRMSYPDSRQAFTNLNGVIPYYDSFNMKLFGNGNYYSLNKSEIDLGPVSKYSMHDDLDESEPAPSPAPGTPHATIPRNSLSSPNINNQLLSLQAMSIASRQQKPLKVTLADNDSFIKNPIKDRATYSVNVVSGSLGRTKTVPNQIQTKKRHSTEIKEILNAVENATQV